MEKSPFKLVFLHYFGGSAKEWSNLAASLSDEFDCHRLNLRGHGGKDDADGYERGLDALIEDVTEYIEEAGLTQYVVVGHSMGGKVAMALAARQPTGLRGLFLLAPSPPTPEPISDKDRALSLKSWGDSVASALCLQMITSLPITKKSAERFYKIIRKQQVQFGIGGIELEAEKIFRIAFWRSVFRSGSCRVRKILSFRQAYSKGETATRLANSRLVRIPGAGHLLPDEAPETVEAALRQFLTVLAD